MDLAAKEAAIARFLHEYPQAAGAGRERASVVAMLPEGLINAAGHAKLRQVAGLVRGFRVQAACATSLPLGSDSYGGTCS